LKKVTQVTLVKKMKNVTQVTEIKKRVESFTKGLTRGLMKMIDLKTLRIKVAKMVMTMMI